MNSLTFPSTGVPYLGAVTLNAAPPAGQPFAGDTSITGPDWGAYGYAPGDQITISGATNVPTTHYSVAGIVGDNLYVTPALPSGALSPNQVNDADVTVACTGFTPELEAACFEPERDRNREVDLRRNSSYVLQGSTQNANITLQDNSGGLAVGPLNAGTGTIQLDVNGPIDGTDGIPRPCPWICRRECGYGGPDRGALDLAITGSGGSIGAVDPLKTAIDGELTATTNDGSVTIVDSGYWADDQFRRGRPGGQGPVVSNGQIVYNSTPSVSPPTYAPGDENVSISSTGPIVLNSISATGDVTITSSAYILEGNAQSPNIIAQEVDLSAEGTAEYQGQVAFADTPAGDTMTLPMGVNWISFGFDEWRSDFRLGRDSPAPMRALHHRDRGEQCPHFDAK